MFVRCSGKMIHTVKEFQGFLKKEKGFFGSVKKNDRLGKKPKNNQLWCGSTGRLTNNQFRLH
jgi:hypothetical protein